MSGGASWSEMFDVRKLRRLAELMNEQGLSEIALEQGDLRMRLRRAGGEPVESHPAPAASRPAKAEPAPPTPANENIALVKSPMVGTFYKASSPEVGPFVKVGDHVGPETTVCIIEAMKVFNEIPAETSGKIVAVLVENGEPVEFGQPLFKVDRSQ